MNDSSRCPNCAGVVATPRPATCQWCGSPLGGGPAVASPPRSDVLSDMPRELPPMGEPPRRRSGFFAALLLIVVIVALATVFLSVRTGPEVGRAPPSPARSATPIERPAPTKGR